MSTNQDHQEVDLLLPDYVLGLLAPDERKRAESHLNECPDCKRQAASDYAAFTCLLVAAPQVDPAPHLRRVILERVTGVVSAPQPMRRRRGWSPRAIIAAMVVPWVLLASGVGGMMLMPRPVAAHMIVMPLSDSSGSYGRFIGMSTEAHGYLILSRIPVAPAGMRYACWLEGSSHIDRACEFGGTGVANLLQIPVTGTQPLSRYSRLMLMMERVAPSPSPRGTLLAAVSLS